MKKVVVFGASGNLGEYFVRYASRNLSDDYEIYAVGRKEHAFPEHNVNYIRCDICNKDDFDNLPYDVYAIVDFAGAMPAKMEGYNPFQYIDVNITGTLNILEYSKKARADRILFMQSFGDIRDRGDEEIILTPYMQRKLSFTSDHTIYVLSKNFAVDLIENYHQLYGIKRFIFRLPTIYRYFKQQEFYLNGKKSRIGFAIMIEKALRGEDIEVWGDPSRVKDMVWIDDFCQMVYKALLIDRDEGYYNVGTGIGTTLIEQINGIIDVFTPSGKEKSHLIFRTDKPNAPQYVMYIENAKYELGYQPEFTYYKLLNAYKEEMEKDIKKLI